MPARLCTYTIIQLMEYALLKILSFSIAKIDIQPRVVQSAINTNVHFIRMEPTVANLH
jgi:hypothetical protein